MVWKDQRFGDVVAKALARRSRNDGHEIEHANRSLPPKDAACAPRYGARKSLSNFNAAYDSLVGHD